MGIHTRQPSIRPTSKGSPTLQLLSKKGEEGPGLDLQEGPQGQTPFPSAMGDGQDFS